MATDFWPVATTGTRVVQIPRIEDEIEQAYGKFQQETDREDDPRDHRMIFEAGFRAARTFMVKDWS